MKISETDLISIIVPVYNGEKYIEKCIDQLINQTYKNIEIIIVNDGSKDNTEDVMKKNYFRNDKIRYFYQNNQGASSARNTGISKAKGKYLCFVDCDDVISKEYISKMYYALISNHADMSFFKVSLNKKNKAYDNLTILNKKSDKFLNYIIKKELLNSPCGKLYNTEILKSKNIHFEKNIHIGEDLLFNANYLLYVDKIYYSTEEIYSYIKQANSITNSFYTNKYDELSYVNKQLGKIFENRMIKGSLKYIKIKNIFSCLRSFSKLTSTDYSAFKEYFYSIRNKEGKQYVNILNFKMFILSLLYNLKLKKLIYILIKKS